MDSILVIDDEKGVRNLLAKVLSQDNVDVLSTGTGAEGLQMADESSPDLILLDLRLPDANGLDLLKTLRSRHPETAVIMITAFGQIPSAVEIQRLQQLQAGKYRADQLVGESDATRALRQVVRQVAQSEAQTILILGESGTGKELVAKGLHYEGSRREFPFMEVNCAAITETLFESELFGHEKGAFTDAKGAKKGLMELADRGTLFLDEVSEMAPGSQAKLLRCLQERVLRRVGGTRDIKVDVRVVAATNRSLETLTKEGKFREDLFYRLNVIPITIPPLRDRRDDVLPLARHFLAELNTMFHKSIKGFTPDTERLLVGYHWPGNVRELRNLIERLVILGATDFIEPRHLPPPFGGPTDGPVAGPAAVAFTGTLADVERAYILQAVERAKGNKSLAAKVLGISRQTLRKKLESP
jgi:two-component system, NtrC family, response regulator AtoC